MIWSRKKVQRAEEFEGAVDPTGGEHAMQKKRGREAPFPNNNNNIVYS
jgi:hypothetical protein